MKTLDLRRLGHLVALADTGHFGRAADAVCLSQPAFSRSIQALEEDVGQVLVERGAGELGLTPPGALLVERARRLLFDAHCLQRDLELYASGDLGDCAFGVGPVPASSLVPGVLAEIRRSHPQVRLRVSVGNWQGLLALLQAEALEFFVADVRDLPLDATLDLTPLPSQSAGFFVRAGHPLAGRPCHLTEVWAHGVATFRLPLAVKAGLAVMLGLGPGQDPPQALECDDVPLLRRLALDSDTVLGSTHALTADDVAAGRLIPLEISPLPPLVVAMGLVSLRNRSPSPLARRAMDLIRQAAGQVGQSAPADITKS